MSKKQKPAQTGIKKVFFITSNYAYKNNEFEYTLSKSNGMKNLKAGKNAELSKDIAYVNNKYTVAICSFEIVPDDLKKEPKDAETNLYKAIITLKDGKSYFFKGNIFFRKNDKNTFIYDFRFEEYKGMIKDTPPPVSIKFTKTEQFKHFLEYFKRNKIKAGEEIHIDFIQDSQNYIFKETFEIDFFLEVFKACYSQKEVKLFLRGFKLEKSYIPVNFNYNNYSGLIKIFDKNPTIITKHCSEKDNPFNYLVKLYSLIFYLRRKYEKNIADEMLSNKELYPYFADFLPRYTTLFPNIICPEELIDQMFKVKLTLNIIKGTFLYTSGVEQILYFINKYINEIKICILNEKKKLIMSTVGLAQESDNLEKIYEEISKIIKYEIENNKEILFSFDRTFWESYVLLNNDLKNLEIINKSIKLCSELEKDLSSEKLGLIEKIHNTGINLIEQGELKNESLLDFIQIDSYFFDRNKEKKFYRPLSILKGLDFESMTDNFFEKWKTSNIFIIYNFDITNFKTALINSINDIKYLGKLLKLFDYKNNKIFDNHVISNLRAKFKNIVTTFKNETCPDFAKDVAFYIYIMDFSDKRNIQSFLKDTIERFIPSLDMIRDIYLFLATEYKDISENAIESVTTYLTNNKERLNAEAIIFLLEKITNPTIIKSLLNKLKYFVIKEEELYNQENNFESFKLLELIQKKDLIDICQGSKGTQYLLNTINLGDKVLNDIKNGQIKYDSFLNIWATNELKNIFKNKLNILLFNNEKDVNACIDKLKNYYKDSVKIMKANIERILSVFNEFYKMTLKDEINQIEVLKNELLSGMICEFSKKELEDKLNAFKLKVDDFSSHYTLKQSLFFTHFFNNSKNKNIVKKEKEIFDDTLKEFNQLKHFFTGNWINNIPDPIIKECFRALKVNSSEQNIEDRMLKEIKIIAKYFNIEKADNDYLTLVGHLLIYNQKEDIFVTAKSCMHFIDELNAEKTQFYTDLNKIKIEIKKNIAVDDIKKHGETLKKYGLKVIDSNIEDKDYLDILQFLSERENSLKFIFDLTDEDIRRLQELVTESEDSFLTNNEIQDMIKCSNFIHKLCEDKDKKTDQELITKFIKLVLDPEYKGYSACFKNYSLNSGQIQTLYNQKMDRSKAALKTIRDILKSSKFNLSLINKKNDFLEFIAKYKREEENNIKDIDIKFEEIIELRGRAMLSKKLGDEKAKEEKEIFKSNKNFAERVNEIEKLKQLLKKLGEKGYCENLKITIHIEDSKPVFYMDNIELKDYDECSQKLNNLLSKTTETQIKYYSEQRTQLIRYLYGRQFNLFKSGANIEPFLKFLTNDSIEVKNLNKVKFIYDRKLNDEDNYINLLENINNFLIDFLAQNKITLKSIYEQNMIKEEFGDSFKGLFTYLLEDDKIGEVQKGIEEHILNWYYFLTGHPPMAQTILLCNEETTSEEITSFLYRAFLCEYNVVFMVGKLDKLTSDNRQTLTNLINSLYKQKEKEMKSCLVFAYSKNDEGTSIVQYLQRINNNDKKYLKHEKKKEMGDISYDENVEIIYSDKPGVGKSTQIKLKIEKIKKKAYIHFPFGGEFDRKDIIERLNEIQSKIIDEEKTVIHLDLYDSKKESLMKDFLYCFLVTKLYGQGESLFYLSKKVEIIIEIPCGFIDFFLKFPILSMFKNKTQMYIEKLPPLIIHPEINSDEQIVCNYLKYFKNKILEEKDIIINGVSLSRQDLSKYLEMIVNKENVPVDNTTIEAESLSQEECYKLIKEYIGIKTPSYYQIISFINVLAGQLRKFSMNYLLAASVLIQYENMFPQFKKKNLKKLRITLVSSFIKNTIHFTQGTFEKLLNSQLDTYKVEVKQGDYDQQKQNEIAIKALSTPGDIISCKKIDPALVFFHEGDGQDFSIITNDNTNKEEYNNLLELVKLPVILQNQYNMENQINKREEIPKELKPYIRFKHREFLEQLKTILNISNPIYKEEKDPNSDIKSIEEIVGDYVFTADNFVKMILILLRIRADIPVIMMGETGCGKTSLIRKLSELINNGESIMEILNIHAGITDKEIVDFLYENKKNEKNKEIKNSSIIARAQRLGEQEEIRKKNYEEEDLKFFEKKYWVFLDEINTCNSTGLICEMMTKHSCQGKPLPKNIFFIAACNPYRYKTKEEDNNALKIEDKDKKNENGNSNLVYKVNPLPFSLLNFVFNFGRLTEDDEKSYIRNMVINPIESFYWKEIEEKKEPEEKLDKMDIKKYLTEDKFKECESLKKLASEAIIKGQKFVIEKNDVSSVSLREIRRFSIFYKFFVEYLRKKKILDSKVDQNENYHVIDTYYKNLTDKEVYEYSINLSIHLCYYMRLTKKEFRKQFADNMFDVFKYNFEDMPKREQNYIADNIELEKGIAKNTALLENLFTLFVCVNSKVPLFIVGKPGCSKSLSVQLLFKAMKGSSSKNTLFKSLPQLFINSYQGSRGSTSQGVLNIFKKARAMLNNENKDKIISMIYFDEMGLAEYSPNNPLKVIHSELEYDLNEGSKKVAFVGISNWSLDASKMNRGLFLSIPQPDKDDLKTTAKIIAESYNPQLAQHNLDLFEAQAETYYKYKGILVKDYPSKQDYHGSRDFYHYIKISMRQLLSKKSETEEDIDLHMKEIIGVNSIERNFAGLEFDNSDNNNIGNKTSLKVIKNIFKEKYPNCNATDNYDVIGKIRENIKDVESRYLLLISKSSVSNYLINSILTSEEMKNDLKKELSFYIGSGFIKDQLSESYGLKVLNKIQLQMEQDKILLLADLECIYPSLYDLFNQNFTVVSGKNYSRLAMGSSNNTFSLVNKNFKCIVFVDTKMLAEEEAPFLNRFEKHIISFENLLRQELLKEANNIYSIIQETANFKEKATKINIKHDLKKLLVNCDKEEIQGIIYCKDAEYKMFKKFLKPQEIPDLVLEKVSLTLCQDIILIMKYSGFKEKYINVYDKIIEYYKKGEHSNLHNFIKTMENYKNVVYTFTSIDEPLLMYNSGKFNSKMFGEIDKTNIKEIQISSLNSENELEAQLEQIYLDPKNQIKIIVIKFNPYETDIMNYVKFFIENYLKEKNYLEENNKKAFIFSIHMNRIFDEDKGKEDYIERNKIGESISHLSDFYQITIDNLNGEDFSLIDIIDLKPEELFKKCLKLDTEFMKNLYNAMSYFNYNFLINIKGIENENFAKMMIKYLENNIELRQMITNCILKQNYEKKDVFEEILNKVNFTKNDVGVISVIQKYLSQLFTDNLAKLVYKSVKENFLSTFLYNQEINENLEIDEKKKNYYFGNELIKKLIELYLEKLDISDAIIKKNMNENNITILLGLKIPGIYPLMKTFRDYIKSEIIIPYFDNERSIKFYLDPKDEKLQEKLENYQNELKNIQKNTEIEIEKNPIFKKLYELNENFPNDFNEFIDMLLDDYYLIYLSEMMDNIDDSYKNLEVYKKILKKMLFYRYEIEDELDKADSFKSLIRTMIWLESYNQYITVLLKIYQKLSLYVENLFEKIEDLLKKGEIKFDEDVRKNPEYSQIYIKSFYFILESLLRIAITDEKLYNNLEGQKYYDFIIVLNTISKDALFVTDELKIYSKEIFTIQQFLDIEKRLNQVNKSNSENILKIIEFLLNQIKNSNNNQGALSDNIISLSKFLHDSLGDTNNYTELISDIFVGEIKKQSSETYRQTLIGIILENPKLISKSYEFITIILRGIVKPTINDIRNNLNNIQNSQNGCLELINKCNNKILNDIILKIFENIFNIYFDSIKDLDDEAGMNYFPKYFESLNNFNENKTFIVFDTSLLLFSDCANCLENIYKSRYEKGEKIDNELICQLYCIAYIKLYLYKLIHFCNYDNQRIGNVEPIMNAIRGNANNEVRQMIKIYVFKIFFHILDRNYQIFSNYNYANHGIPFFKDLERKFDEQKKAMLNYYMIPYGDKNIYEKFKEDFEKFDKYRAQSFEKNTKEFKEYIENDGLDSFYIISTDIIISNLADPNYVKNFDEYLKYSSFVKSIFQQDLKINKITRNLFLLFSDDETFKNVMLKKIEEKAKEINGNTFEILLYSLRFCLQTSNCENRNEYLYSQIISKECEKKLNENCILGNNLLDDIKVNNYFLVENHLNTKADNVGAYVCSCGTYYSIDPCGFPMEESKCANCGLPTGKGELPPNIGKRKHGFALRKDHFRIFKDLNSKKAQFDRYGSDKDEPKNSDNDDNIPNMLLEDYKKIIEEITNKKIYGVNRPQKESFLNPNHKVRNLSVIGYRLLNYIIYSHLFYANCLNYLSDEELEKYLCDGMTCIEMIENNWKILEKALQAKGIQIIQIFINLIFDRLCQKLKNYKEIKTINDRDKYEGDIEKLLEGCYKEYEDYSMDYNEINEKSLQIDKDNMKSLVLENKDIEKYDEEEYPFYKYFLMTTYPSKDNFKEQIMINENKYPLISIILNEDLKEKYLIKYLPEFNEFSNYMIEKYSYQITREYASKKLIKEEEIYKNENFKEKFDIFIENWEQIKEYSTNFVCMKDKMPIINLSADTPLAYFLNDNGELGKGMYIAAAYENFISWQNKILDKLIDTYKQSGILHHFVKNLEKKIDVQNAKKNDILDFDDIDIMLNEIIYKYSKRNILTEDNNLNLRNYRQIVYDFDSIEKYLGELLLPGKSKFNSVDNLKYITYCFEGFRGNKSSILSDFRSKYTQKELSPENKQIIFKIIKDKLLGQYEDFQKILFSIQLLIFYLIKERQKETEEIKAIINDLPDYVNLSKECINFFQDPNLKIKFEELLDVYSYIELLCYKPIIDNLRQHYKKKLEESQAKNIINLFEEKKFILITKETLAAACRRFISRYLVSNRDDTEYEENKLISNYLLRYELWPISYIENEELLKQDIDALGKENITIGQLYELYNLMNVNEKKEFEKFIENDEKNKNKGEGKIMNNIIQKKDRVRYRRNINQY